MQYLLFAGYNYYPGGGMNDFVDEYDSIESARSDLSERDTMLIQVLSIMMKTLKVGQTTRQKSKTQRLKTST
jgi:hypothetical protein